MAPSVSHTFLGVSQHVGDGYGPYGDQVGMQVLHIQKILPSNQNPMGWNKCWCEVSELAMLLHFCTLVGSTALLQWWSLLNDDLVTCGLWRFLRERDLYLFVLPNLLALYGSSNSLVVCLKKSWMVPSEYIHRWHGLHGNSLLVRLSRLFYVILLCVVDIVDTAKVGEFNHVFIS